MYLEVLLQEAVLLCLSRSWGGFHYLQFYCLLDNTLLLFGQNLYLIVCTLFCLVGYSACDYTSLNPDGVFRALERLLKPTFCSIPCHSSFEKHLFHILVFFSVGSLHEAFTTVNKQWWTLKPWVSTHCFKLRHVSDKSCFLMNDFKVSCSSYEFYVMWK